VLDSVQRQRFILNEQVVIYGLFGLPHKWEVAPSEAPGETGEIPSEAPGEIPGMGESEKTKTQDAAA
jgi:hypothetical protein